MALTTSFLAMIFTIFFLAVTNNTMANSNCPDDGSNTNPMTGCPNAAVPVVMLSFPPYVMFKDDDSEDNRAVAAYGIVFDYIVESFERCCQGTRSLYLVNNLEEDTESHSFHESLALADIIFPVKQKLETELTFSGIGYTFHDIVKTHGYVLIGRIDHYNEKARRLVLRSLYDSWPIFAIIFLLAGIAGIVIWALEYHVKNEEFPLSFTRGSYEGFWWAFISMTTVGYGDKTPRSFIGRLFGVVWILLGLIVITMFAATVTSALTHSSSPEFINSLEGQDVAVLSQDSEAQAEASYSGATPHLYEDFEDLYEALLHDEVDGIFMDRLQAYYYYKDKADDENLRVFDTIHVEIPYKMALKINTTCTFLEKNFCFRRRLENPLTHSLIKEYTSPLKVFKPSVDTEGLLSGTSPYTGILLLAILGVFLGLFMLGVIVDFFVLKSRKRLFTSQERKVSGASFPHINLTLNQLETLGQDLGKLSSQVQSMKERLTTSNRQGPKWQTDESVKLTEVNVSSSVS